MSLNARPDLRLLGGLVRKAGPVAPRGAGQWLQDKAARSAWFWRRRIGGLNWQAARRKIFSGTASTASDGLRHDEFDRADEIYLGLMSRYIPPRIDVEVTCFIAERGRAFDTDPRPWRRLAKRVATVGVPGTHHTLLISGRSALACALGKALADADDEPGGPARG